MTSFAANALRASGFIAVFLFTIGGTPTNGTPTNGTPTNGTPTNGTPTNGTPTNGTPTNGPKLDDLESSLVFANKAVHEALIGRPFTAANLTDPNSPVFQIWFDPFSTILLSYLWQDAHAMGDDLTFTLPWGVTFRFYGNLGLCDRGGTGWARNAPLDESCARWLSALIIAQVNQSGVHNLFSARGPTSRRGMPGFIGRQLTDMGPALHSFEYKFGTEDPVEALHDACPAGTVGPDNCGWQPGLIGTGTPGALVKVSLDSRGVRMLAQVNQGIMAHNYPFAPKGSCSGAAGCTDPDVLGVDVSGTLNPSVQFTIPPSGVFNAQWTTAARNDLATGVKPVMTARVVGRRGTVRFPANELDIFPPTNREMTASGNIFGQTNIDPEMWSCEARLDEGGTRLCDASNQEFCVPCERQSKPGAMHVIFPHAHLWLSRNWNNAQDYYRNRSCSSDLSTCIATLEGYIDAAWLNPATGRAVPPCLVQSFDTDTYRPLFYRGAPRPLYDANSCSAGTVVSASHNVTTFFPNYRDIGACGALGAEASTSCAYTPRRPPRGDKEHDDDDEHGDDD